VDRAKRIQEKLLKIEQYDTTIGQTFFSFLSRSSSSSELELVSLSDSLPNVIFFLFLFLQCCLRSLRFACRFCFFSSACSFSRCCCHNRSILRQLINCSLAAHNITSTMCWVLEQPQNSKWGKRGKGKGERIGKKAKGEKVQEKTLMEINFWLWP